MTIVWFALDILFNATASVLVKASTRAVTITGALLNPKFLVAIVCFGLSLIAYQRVLVRYPLAVAYPVVISGTLVLVTTLGSWIMREPVPAIRFVGSLVIVAGVWMVMR